MGVVPADGLRATDYSGGGRRRPPSRQARWWPRTGRQAARCV